MTRPVARHGERGFALLIVFLLAAAIGLMLYQQMPRVAFESERDKEQLLIDRGEQYKRAIYLYMQVNKRYPARMEDLENTNDKRFLRRRYIDPYTGKNEWRLIHTNGVALTDSLVQKPPAAPDPNNPNNPNNPSGTGSGSTTTGSNTTSSNTTSTTSPTGTPAPPDINATVYQRPSDRTLPTGTPGQFNGQQPNTDPNQVGVGPGQMAFPPITLSQIQNSIQGTNGQTGQPGQPGAGQQPLPGQQPVAGNGPGTFQPGFPNNGLFPNNSLPNNNGLHNNGVPPVPVSPAGRHRPLTSSTARSRPISGSVPAQSDRPTLNRHAGRNSPAWHAWGSQQRCQSDQSVADHAPHASTRYRHFQQHRGRGNCRGSQHV